jgi:acetyltransferase-like isoleucine patch superfamily enzyme
MNQNQLRNNLKYKLIHRLRWFYWKSRLGGFGKNIHISNNVRFLRFLKNIFIHPNVVIKEGARICSCNNNALIEIGENTTIGYHTFIFSSNKIKIGADCLIAPFVYIVDSNHSIERDKLINQQPNVTAPIDIGNDVWIASNVTILKGVKIGNGAVVGSHSVVNKDVEAYTIVGGIPAKEIGKR